MAHNQAQIVRLLEAINEGDPSKVFRRSVQNDATAWVARTLRYGANLGLDPEVSSPIVFDTLNEIGAMVAACIERERRASC